MKNLILIFSLLGLSSCVVGIRRDYEYHNRGICLYHGGIDRIYYPDHRVEYICRDGESFSFFRSY